MICKTCFLSLVCFALAFPVSAAEQSSVKHLDFEPRDTERDRVVPVRVYFSKVKSPQPVVLFSHGLGGSRENNSYLGTYWAAAGYVCVFMQHAGSDREVWRAVKLSDRMSALKNAASGKSTLDRMQDVSFVIDQLEKWNQEKGHPLQGKMDLEHIGMSGHSFGAVTTLDVSGRKYPFGKSFAEERIDAFFAMSPQPGKGMSASRALGHITAPFLCMTGTKDDSPINKRVTPETRREVYTALPAGDKYELVFDGGHHFTFGDSKGFRTRGRDPDHHPAIQKISLNFWDAYLRDDKSKRQWLQSKKPLTDCKLKATDVWLWK
ncbi:dienelactone hydrolase [uncultured Gimesia sp.]|uniref:alpha/beta hydrolase family protein n=1 Tax=uncultured Gimesia sp. TaxID=1678688 RepID=UPI002631EE5E|nr:dienelactone hydrolase [uncultured Gimesia sp.]